MENFNDMAQEYFSHDYHARNHCNLENIQIKHGMAGIGVFWCIVEMLYEQHGRMRLDYERIAFALRTDVNCIKSVINDFDLFVIDGDIFYSESILGRLEQRDKKSVSARESANKRWNKCERNANASKNDAIKENKEVLSNNIINSNTLLPIDDSNENIKKPKKVAKEIPLWKKDQDVYKKETLIAFAAINKNDEFRENIEYYYPNINFGKSLDKICRYWISDIGYKNKKNKRTTEIDWLATVRNAFGMASNRLWLTKEEIEERNK